MSESMSLGEVAYRAYQNAQQYVARWDGLSVQDKQTWEDVASAVTVHVTKPANETRLLMAAQIAGALMSSSREGKYPGPTDETVIRKSLIMADALIAAAASRG